jgi:hypothetical protein
MTVLERLLLASVVSAAVVLFAANVVPPILSALESAATGLSLVQ